MQKNKPNAATAKSPANAKSVSVTILSEFFDNIEKEEGLGDVAHRLRKVVLEEGVFSELNIRAALFSDIP